MQYEVDVLILKGKVSVKVDAKSPKEAEKKAIKEVEEAEAGFHGNYPPCEKYMAVVQKSEQGE